MNSFLIALIQVACMLVYAVPGYIFVKIKSIRADSISSFSKILMFVCQPCMTIYAFNNAEFSVQTLKNTGLIFLLSLLLMSLFLTVLWFAFKKKNNDVTYRVFNIASCFGNCMFMGLPLLTALFPLNPEVTVYSTGFFLSMNLLGWTVGSAIITKSKKYVTVKKLLLNPAIISVAVALILYSLKFKLPSALDNMVTLVGKSCTPLCMLVMGMRLGTVSSAKSLFLPWKQYFYIFIKQVIFPLCGLVLLLFLPIDYVVKCSLFIMLCCPVASIVQNFAEMLGEGQETSANMVVLGTIISVITIPLMCLFLPLLA